MNRNVMLGLSLLGLALFPAVSFAGDDVAPPSAQGGGSPGSLAPHPSMKENVDGNLREGEYEVISMNGSITRALCPYTCEMRGIPKKSCKTWGSLQDRTKCYVQDTRIPSGAVPIK